MISWSWNGAGARVKSWVMVWSARIRRPCDFNWMVAQKDRADRPDAGWEVVDEVVAEGVADRTEGSADEIDLRVPNRAAGLVLHPAFELTGGGLGVKVHAQGSRGSGCCPEPTLQHRPGSPHSRFLRPEIATVWAFSW